MQVPIAIALGYDKPLPGLMERKPRPLSQPVLSRAQWARLIFIGLLVALGTLAVEITYEPIDARLAATMGFAAFSLFNVIVGFSSRSETETLFQVENFTDRRQLMLYGLSLLITFLSTELGFTQRILGLVRLDGQQWLLCIGLAVALALVYEVIKVFLRRSQGAAAAQPGSSSTLASSAGS